MNRASMVFLLQKASFILEQKYPCQWGWGVCQEEIQCPKPSQQVSNGGKI